MPVYSCELCTPIRFFAKKSNFDRHKKSHTRVEYACSVCMKTYNRQFHVINHISSRHEISKAEAKQKILTTTSVTTGGVRKNHAEEERKTILETRRFLRKRRYTAEDEQNEMRLAQEHHEMMQEMFRIDTQNALLMQSIMEQRVARKRRTDEPLTQSEDEFENGTVVVTRPNLDFMKDKIPLPVKLDLNMQLTESEEEQAKEYE